MRIIFHGSLKLANFPPLPLFLLPNKNGITENSLLYD